MLEDSSVLQGRLRARANFTDWCRYRGFNLAPHHLLITTAIQDFLANPDEKILLLFAPPGSAKSTYVSILFPPWYLANHPRNSILAATHNVEFAERWGRRVRNDIALEAHVLGISLRGDNAAAGRWAITAGGEYMGVGAGVGISGFRADLGLVDDLFGSREDAYSETVRKKRWEWYVSDFSARLKPGAKRILMNTRWHEEDVAGMVLNQIETGKVRGRVISIPAIAESKDDPLGRKLGEYLWDGDPKYRYGDYLRERQQEETPMMWSALYQQRPAPEEGDYFKAAWMIPYEDRERPPLDKLRVYGGSDYAVTTDGGDYTVHVVVGLDENAVPWVLDLWRKQASSDVWVETFCDMVKKWKPISWAEETGQIKAGVGPFLERRMIERQAMTFRQQFPTRGDKAVRAQAIRGRMALRGLRVPASASWLPDFRRELLSFPAGKHDDQVDAIGLVGQLLTLPHVEPIVVTKKPTQHIIEVDDQGRYISNMTMREIVDLAAKRRKERERD